MPIAFITGASSGIGAEFARQLHRKGYDLVLVARRGDLLTELCSDLNALRASSARMLVADLTSIGGHHHLSPESKSADSSEIIRFIQHERIDLFVSNAGVGSFGEFDEIDWVREQQILLTNVFAPTLLLHCVVKKFKAQRSGGIIIVSSVAGIQPLPYMATYGASKAFNLSHGLALRSELRRYGVNVLTICPGPTATEFGGVARVPGKMTGLPRDRVEHVVADSLKAFEKRRAYVIPGWRGRLLAPFIYFLPLTFRTWVTARLLYPSLGK